MTTRERLSVTLDGGTPDITTLSFYSWMAKDFLAPEWRELYEMGLGICHHCHTLRHIEHGVENSVHEKKQGNDVLQTFIKATPVGNLHYVKRNGWTIEHWIKTPEDYKIMSWIVENTEIAPCYEEYDIQDKKVGDNGVPVILGSRTPAMSINVDWAGTEQFCMDLALELPELLELYEIRKDFFRRENALIAAGPGKYVKWLENLTIDMLGPKRYQQLLLSVYDECVPVLEASGKRVMVHYDGELKQIADLIARAPFHIIDSLTEPPEGNLMFDECRRLWQDKVFWANINVALYYGAEEELRQALIDKRDRAGKRAFAFEISEKLPAHWQRVIPVILDTLNTLS
ncbi:hypothetical protein JXJ21_05430 [candidate division KSB1 bacterium]|nr:hypothetical protein [candidate division KSB1 bacterium]